MSENHVDNYGWDREKPTHSTSYLLPRIKAVLAAIEVKRIADLGSGRGEICGEFAKLGYQVVGIEHDKHGFEIAKSTYPDVHFYNLGIHDDPKILLTTEKKFDVVISTEVIEHLFSPHLLPLFAQEVLKEHGYLIISTPYHGYIKNLALSLLNQWDAHHTALWHGGHIKFWSRKTITTLLEQNGFKVQGFFGIGRLPYLWKSMIIVAKKA